MVEIFYWLFLLNFKKASTVSYNTAKNISLYYCKRLMLS